MIPEKFLDGVAVIEVSRHNRDIARVRELIKNRYLTATEKLRESHNWLKIQNRADSSALELLKQRYPEIYWEIVKGVAHLYQNRIITTEANIPKVIAMRPASDCEYCGISHIDIKTQLKLNPMTIDHIFERSDGGQDEFSLLKRNPLELLIAWNILVFSLWQS